MLFSMRLILFSAVCSVVISYQTKQLTEVNDTNHLNRVIKNTRGLVVIKYSTVWCQTCKKSKQGYSEMASKYGRPGKVTFYEVNDDDTSIEADVVELPTFKIYDNGKEIFAKSGAKAFDALKSEIENMT